MSFAVHDGGGLLLAFSKAEADDCIYRLEMNSLHVILRLYSGGFTYIGEAILPQCWLPGEGSETSIESAEYDDDQSINDNEDFIWIYQASRGNDAGSFSAESVVRL